MTIKKDTLPELGLVGRYYHTRDSDDTIHWQGMVRGDLGDGYYLVELCEWFSGSVTHMLIVHIKDMYSNGELKMKWHFYEDREDMVFRYEEYSRRQDMKDRREERTLRKVQS